MISPFLNTVLSPQSTHFSNAENCLNLMSFKFIKRDEKAEVTPKALFRKQSEAGWVVIVRKSSGKLKAYLEQVGEERGSLFLKGIPNQLETKHVQNAIRLIADSRFFLRGNQLEIRLSLKGGIGSDQEGDEQSTSRKRSRDDELDAANIDLKPEIDNESIEILEENKSAGFKKLSKRRLEAFQGREEIEKLGALGKQLQDPYKNKSCVGDGHGLQLESIKAFSGDLEEEHNLLFQDSGFLNDIEASHSKVIVIKGTNFSIEQHEARQTLEELNYLFSLILEAGMSLRADFLEKDSIFQISKLGNKENYLTVCLEHIYNALNNTERNKEVYSRALCVRQRILENPKPYLDLAFFLHSLGIIYINENSRPEASQCLAVANKTPCTYYPDESMALVNLGNLSTSLKKPAEAFEYYKQALYKEEAKPLLKNQNPAIALIFKAMGSMFQRSGDFEKAKAYYEKALEMNKTLYGDSHLKVAKALYNLGILYSFLKEPQKAINKYKQALNIYKEWNGNNCLSVANVLNNLGGIYLSLGKDLKAEQYLWEALEIKQGLYGDKNTKIAKALYNLGVLYSSLKEPQKAISKYKQALNIYRALKIKNDSCIANVLNNLGGTYMSLKEYLEARRWLLEALSIKKALYGEKDPVVTTTLGNLRIVYRGLITTYLKQHKKIKSLIQKKVVSEVTNALENLSNVYRDLAIAYSKEYDKEYGGEKSIGGCNDSVVASNLLERLGCNSFDNPEDIIARLNQKLGDALDGLNSKFNNLKSYDQAVAFYRSILEVNREIYGEEHPLLFTICKKLKEAKEILSIKYSLVSEPFEKEAEGISFKKICTTPDGACLFRALCWGANILNNHFDDKDNRHRDIRWMVVKHIEEHLSQYSAGIKEQLQSFANAITGGLLVHDLPEAFVNEIIPIISEGQDALDTYWDIQGIEKYLYYMKEDYTWGGPVEIRAAADIMNVNIVVHESKNIQSIISVYGNSTHRTIHLAFTGNHYDLLVPVKCKKLLPINVTHPEISGCQLSS